MKWIGKLWQAWLRWNDVDTRETCNDPARDVWWGLDMGCEPSPPALPWRRPDPSELKEQGLRHKLTAVSAVRAAEWDHEQKRQREAGRVEK